MNGLPKGILVFLLMALAAELIWSVVKRKAIYPRREVLANLGVAVGNQLLRPLVLLWKVMVFQWLEPFQLAELPLSGPTLLATFLAVELMYYWYHRLSHQIPLLWAIHHTHHSSTAMNLTTAVRLNWLGGLLAPLFFAPLILLGFPSKWVIFSLVLGLVYQYFLHTQAVGRLGFLEGWLFNTPAAHRAHHGANPCYIDTNFGGCLILFDRLFGTWQAEEEAVTFGVTTGPASANPFVIVFGPLIDWCKRSSHR